MVLQASNKYNLEKKIYIFLESKFDQQENYRRKEEGGRGEGHDVMRHFEPLCNW